MNPIIKWIKVNVFIVIFSAIIVAAPIGMWFVGSSPVSRSSIRWGGSGFGTSSSGGSALGGSAASVVARTRNLCCVPRAMDWRT